MLTLRLIGALLLLGGIFYMARAAINRGRLSDAHADPDDTPAHTLEPPHRGPGFLGLHTTWPGLVMIGVGALFLLLPLFL
ncbi:hypothetical protein BH23PSE1_BH23PSE1_03740 [soil metagenome]